MLLCAARAAVQVQRPRNAAIAKCSRRMAIGCACCAPLASSSSSRTGRIEAAERTRYAACATAELLLLPPHPLLPASGSTASSSPRRGGHGAARRAQPWLQYSAAPAARPHCPTVRTSVLRDSAAPPALGRTLSRRTRRPRRSRPWRHGAARRCCSRWRRAGSCHGTCSTAQRSRQRCSRAGRAGQSRCCLAQLASAHFSHRCSPARLLPWRAPQAASRFAPLFCALQPRCMLLTALRSLCCGPACAVPCYARSTLFAPFAVGLSIALQTQQRACRPFHCSADVDT
jgi:hypothetical protein